MLDLRHDSHVRTSFGRFLGEFLEILENDRNAHEDTGTRTDDTHEVAHDRKETNAKSTEGGSSGNVSVKLLEHGLLA